MISGIPKLVKMYGAFTYLRLHFQIFVLDVSFQLSYV